MYIFVKAIHSAKSTVLYKFLKLLTSPLHN